MPAADLARIERTLSIQLDRMNVAGGLTREERPKPVDVTGMVATKVGRGSQMVRMPGEVFQRYAE